MRFDAPVIGILRGIDQEFFGELLPIAFIAGLTAIEVTMNTPGATAMVREFRPAVPAGRWLGMGTIRNLEEARQAVEAGAMFLVTPNCDPAVIAYANSEQVPVVTGALTPTEVYAAWAAGADMVKVFPCGALGGPHYIRALRGPFDQIPLAAVGGVTLHNLPEYFSAGANAVGVATSLFGTKALRQKNLIELGQNVKNFMDHCRKTPDGV